MVRPLDVVRGLTKNLEREHTRILITNLPNYRKIGYISHGTLLHRFQVILYLKFVVEPGCFTAPVETILI